MKKIYDGECEHCLIPDKSRWTTDCLYKGDWPSHKAFVRSTFDPPCACDAYDDGQAELRRHNARVPICIFLMAVLAIAAAVYFQ